MQFRYLKQILAVVFVLVISGCAANDKAKTYFDINEISEDVYQPEIPPALVDKAIDQPEEEKIETSTVRDFPKPSQAGNPYLRNIEEPKVPQPASLSGPGEGVLLNFDNADIYEVLQVITELLDISYIVDPKVKGVVNIRSGKKIPIDQLYSVFKKLLNINGLDIRSEGEYYYIYPAAKPASQIIYGMHETAKLQDSPRIVIQVVPVMHMSSTEAVKVLKPYLSEQGVIQNLENLNMLFVTDYESKVLDALTILHKLDISPLAALNIRLVRVEKAPLFDLKDELNEILTAMQVNKQGHEGVTILALERVNSLLLLSPNGQLLDNATRWALELDVVPTEGRDNIYIYNVRNSVASELAGLVNDLISGNSSAHRVEKSTSPSVQNASAEGGQKAELARRPPARRSTSGSDSNKSPSGLRFAGEPTLIADDSRNIVILRTLPADYSRIVKLLERLDNMPRQVLIEVLVAEVRLSEGWNMGVEWALRENGRLKIDGSTYTNNYGTEFGSLSYKPADDGAVNTFFQAVATNGFTYSVLNSANDVVGLFNTIADDNEVSILSSPQVMVLNNETATINVGNQVPIVTSQTNNLTTSGSDTSTQTIQYEDTGVILTVTPKINYDGVIILDIEQQVSSAEKNTLGGTESPIISSRELKTKLAVKNSQTILMGGLIETNESHTDSGVPLLKDIPLLGWLFKYQTKSTDRTELLVMITPHVIESDNVLAQYARKFDEKMIKLRRQLHQKKDEEPENRQKEEENKEI